MRYKVNGRPVSATVGLTVFGAFAVLWVVLFALQAWVVMLLLGAVHHSVWDSIPALGYGPSLILTAAIGVVAGLLRK